jgi:hypothetical protein
LPSGERPKKTDKKSPASAERGRVNDRTFDQNPGIYQGKSAKDFLSFLGTTESKNLFDYLP